MLTAVEGQKILERVFRTRLSHIISSYDMKC